MRLGSKDDIVEQVVVFKDTFNFVWRNMTVGFLTNEGNTYNLEIQFGLRKPGWQNLICIRRKWVLNVFLNFLEIRTWWDNVSHYNDTFVLYMNEIGYCARFDWFESMIDIDYM